jgi:putative oxidoreductase
MLKQSYSLQRLFSTFANGWPGAGILLQRGLVGFLLLHKETVQVLEKPLAVSMIPEGIGAAAGILLLVGLWTPVAGIVAALVEVWIILAQMHDPWIHTVLATLSASLAMIGPGAWSLDARIFGRKHIETRLSPQSRSGPSH